MTGNKLRNLADSLLEIFTIIKACLTTIWFWLPILYMFLFLFHLWMIFYIHPLTLFMFPGALAIYSVYLDNKRTKARYNLQIQLTAENHSAD
jgi:hypothetical protein